MPQYFLVSYSQKIKIQYRPTSIKVIKKVQYRVDLKINKNNLFFLYSLYNYDLKADKLTQNLSTKSMEIGRGGHGTI